MKKTITLIFIILFGIVITACQPMENPSEILEKLHDIVDIGFVSGDTLDSVTQNITLETNYEGYENVDIVWVSNSDVISIEGNTGIVTRPESNSLVRLSATLKLSGAQKTKHFALTVLKQSDTPDPTKPVISGFKNYDIKVGDPLPNFLDGVIAKDSLNNTLEVVVISNNINLNQAGVYEVKLGATDALNNQTIVIIKVTVTENSVPVKGETFTETFETNNAPTSTQYGDGSFTSQGIKWTFNHAINAGVVESGAYQINGGGILLRRASDSFLKADFTGGLQAFSFDWRKAFTGGTSRNIEIIITDLTTNATTTYEASMNGGGEVTTVFGFEKTDLSILGDWSLTIKIKGTAATNAHITIDNFSWTTNTGEVIPQNELDALEDKASLTLRTHIVDVTTLELLDVAPKGSLISWSLQNENDPNKALINLDTGEVTLPSSGEVSIIIVATITNGDFTTNKTFTLSIGENLNNINNVRQKTNNTFVYTQGVVTAVYETTTQIKFFIEDTSGAIHVIAPLNSEVSIEVGQVISIKGTKTSTNNQLVISDIRSINLVSIQSVQPKDIETTQLGANPDRFVQIFGLIHNNYNQDTKTFVFETMNGSFEALIPNDLDVSIQASIQSKLTGLNPGIGVTIKAPVYQIGSSYYLLLTNTVDILVDEEIDINTMLPMIINKITLPDTSKPVIGNIDLTTSEDLLFGVTIEWISSNPLLLSNTGVVTRPDDRTVVSLSYNVKYLEDNIESDTFELTIESKVPAFEGYYESLNGLVGTALQTELYSILNDTGTHTTTTYGDARDILEESDVWVNYNTDYLYLIYTDTLKGSVNQGYPDEGPALAKWDNGSTWNREHVWAKSLFGTGGYEPNNSTRGIDADMHNLRAADTTVNSTRNNNTFINQVYKAEGFGNYSGMWYPGDHHRGDVARILFYMDIRWGSLTNLNQIADLSTLLEWHILDPVDAFEVNRNNIIFNYQNNRNPFIDYPELVEMVYA